MYGNQTMGSLPENRQLFPSPESKRQETCAILRGDGTAQRIYSSTPRHHTCRIDRTIWFCPERICLEQDSEIQTWFSLQKKTLYPTEQQRDDVKMKRDVWMSEQPEMALDKLVFIDETGINTGMTRLYGRASSNRRVVDYTPDVRFARTTVLSSVRASAEMVPLIFECALDGEQFREYVVQCLVPTLLPGDIVIMDN